MLINIKFLFFLRISLLGQNMYKPAQIKIKKTRNTYDHKCPQKFYHFDWIPPRCCGQFYVNYGEI